MDDHQLPSTSHQQEGLMTVSSECLDEGATFGGSPKRELSPKKDVVSNGKPKAKRRKKSNRKSFDMDLLNLSSQAQNLQRLEKERLERLDRDKKDLETIYTPVLIKSSEEPKPKFTNKEEDPLKLTDEEEEEDDDDLIIEEVIPVNRQQKDDQIIELGSSDDETENANNNISSKFNIPPRMQRLSRCNAATYWQYRQLELLRAGKQKNQRKRRHSADYDKKEITPEGRLLINAGKPEGDVDVFVAPHLTQVLQPHQIGGVKFMYDNIIESQQIFQRSDGVGCILAHSMGLGKTIQAITFIELFIRVTTRKRVLVICPVNVLQNWNNEFEKWLPREDPLTGLPIRDWELFLLGDAVKSFEARAKLVTDWHKEGGVLLLGYEMFRLLIQREEGSQSSVGGGARGRKGRKLQQERSVWDLQEGLAKLGEEDRRKIAQKEELGRGIREALLSPGPDLVICDEGHRIKNLNTEVANALSAINTKRRIVLTGYPLQNNLMEYFCMIEFVRPSYLGSRKEFLAMFEKPIRNGQCIDSTRQDVKMAKQRIHVLTNMLRGFVQRRSQHLLKKILPESREFVLLLRKSPIQHALYRAFYHYANAQVHAGEIAFNPLKGFAICMKIVNHPDLLYQAVLKKRKKASENNESEGAEANVPGDLVPPEEIKTEEGTNANGFSSSSSSVEQQCQQQPSSSTSWFSNSQPSNAFHPLPYHQQQQQISSYPNQPTPFLASYPPTAYLQPGPATPYFSQQPTRPTPNWQMGGTNSLGPMFGNGMEPGVDYGHRQQNNSTLPQQQTHPFGPPPGYAPPPPPQQQQLNPLAFTIPTQHPPPFFHHHPPPPLPPLFPSQNASSTSSHFPPFPPNNPFDQPKRPYQFGLANGTGSSSTSTDIFRGTFLDNDDVEEEGGSSSRQSQDAGSNPVENGKVKQEEGHEALGEGQKEQKQKAAPQNVGNGTRKRPKAEVNDLLADEFLLEDASISLDWAEPFLKDYLAGLADNSSKLFIAMKIIAETVRRGEKLLLFSQSVVTLNLIEGFLKDAKDVTGPDGKQTSFQRNKTYCRFDGTTSGTDREKLIKRFNENPELRLFLISTKAGSLGVNLVSANRVIIFDVSWNPCHDAQAIFRIYRYGQKRKTYIYRLIMGNCMEKQVFNRQISKQGLQKRVIDEQMIDANVTTREVQNLMEYDEALDVVSTSSDKGLDFMLDEGNELDDDLLLDLVQSEGRCFMETPFLHESMMLERGEEGLSQEEKYEAELLYEREKQGINFPPAQDMGQPQTSELENLRRRMGYANPPLPPPPSFPFDVHRLSQTTPLPKNLELAVNSQQQQQQRQLEMLAQLQQQQHQSQEEREVMITREMSLPKVVVANGTLPDYTLYPGQRVKMFSSSKGNIYLRTVPDGLILDATKFCMDQQFGRPQQIQKPKSAVAAVVGPEEVIQIDD